MYCDLFSEALHVSDQYLYKKCPSACFALGNTIQRNAIVQLADLHYMMPQTPRPVLSRTIVQKNDMPVHVKGVHWNIFHFIEQLLSKIIQTALVYVYVTELAVSCMPHGCIDKHIQFSFVPYSCDCSSTIQIAIYNNNTLASTVGWIWRITITAISPNSITLDLAIIYTQV